MCYIAITEHEHYRECTFENVSFGPCIDFSTFQSIHNSIQSLCGIYCMSLGTFCTPQGRIIIHLSEVDFLYVWSAHVPIVVYVL